MLPPSLEKIRAEIEDHAREYGLDFFQTIFEVIDSKQISEIAAYGGFPTRYPHWRFGMEFDKLDKGYTYGMQRIYEMVINNDPCYAYLMSSNPTYDQKTVIGHVYAHCDFFKNNMWFAGTNRKMMDEMANHSARIRSYIDKNGLEQVESFLDIALSLENLTDPYESQAKMPKADSGMRVEESQDVVQEEVPRFKSKKYMDRYINPQEYLDSQLKRKEEEKQSREKRFPEQPTRDVLGFLIENAPLKEWQLDILSIIREEAYYFAPQWMTKIMNEGWATYWHSKIMTERAMKASELVEYADHFSGVVYAGKGQLNPYKIGLELFRDIEERWDKGRFGREYHNCENMTEKFEYDTGLGEGRNKIFEVRKIYNDITFIEEFLTAEFCSRHKLFVFDYNKKRERWEIMSREFEKIKQALLQNLTNAGSPFIYVLDGNF